MNLFVVLCSLEIWIIGYARVAVLVIHEGFNIFYANWESVKLISLTWEMDDIMENMIQKVKYLQMCIYAILYAAYNINNIYKKLGGCSSVRFAFDYFSPKTTQ